MAHLVINRVFQAPAQSYFLFGPRGTGKTTWLKQHYPNGIMIDLLDTTVFRQLSAKPERLEEMVEAHPAHTWFILDEIQKIPALLDIVHRLIEMHRGWQFILTGSSTRKLKSAGVNLLAGRALLRHMHPFMACELEKKFSLTHALTNGMVPLVVEAYSPPETLKGYIGIYLKEEIQQEGIVRNIGNFSRFLETISFSQGSHLNHTNISREAAIHRKVVANYISVLEDLLLGFMLPVFAKRAKRILVSYSKFYFFDCGVFSALRPQGILDKPAEIQGQALETLVAQHLKAWCDYSSTGYSLYFWRTQLGVEVDFILYGTNGFYAIEVKNSATVHPQDTKSLRVFCQEHPEVTPILLYRGKVKLKQGDIVCIPVEMFLKELIPNQPVPC
jgi:uncharacterized protein